MAEILTSCGHSVAVDDDDYPWLSRWTWRLSPAGYAVATVGGRAQLMHRLIMSAQRGQITDHRDRDTLNNRRDNLRIVSALVSTLNRGMQRNNTSGFKGVIAARSGRWRARVKVNRKFVCLGTYSQAEDAAMAYDSAAARLLGPDAFLNFMPAPSNGQGTNDSAEGIRRALAEGAG